MTFDLYWATFFQDGQKINVINSAGLTQIVVSTMYVLMLTTTSISTVCNSASHSQHNSKEIDQKKKKMFQQNQIQLSMSNIQ